MTMLTIQEAIDHYEKLYKKIETYARFMKRLDKEHKLNPIEIATYKEYKLIAEWLKELQHYKDLEEQGLLLELPCKVGDTVWLVEKDFPQYPPIKFKFSRKSDIMREMEKGMLFYATKEEADEYYSRMVEEIVRWVLIDYEFGKATLIHDCAGDGIYKKGVKV